MLNYTFCFVHFSLKVEDWFIHFWPPLDKIQTNSNLFEGGFFCIIELFQ